MKERDEDKSRGGTESRNWESQRKTGENREREREKK